MLKNAIKKQSFAEINKTKLYKELSFTHLKQKVTIKNILNKTNLCVIVCNFTCTYVN